MEFPVSQKWGPVTNSIGIMGSFTEMQNLTSLQTYRFGICILTGSPMHVNVWEVLMYLLSTYDWPVGQCMCLFKWLIVLTDAFKKR